MRAATLSIRAGRAAVPPSSAPAPSRSVALGWVADQYRVTILWQPEPLVFPTYDKALRFAERVARQNGWKLVNNCPGRAS